MDLFGLIGYPVSHSFSPSYFARKFSREQIKNCDYQLFPLKQAAEFAELVKANPNLRGVNVTIPHKQAIMPLLHEVHPVAQKIGAVNVVKVFPDGRLKGFNSDYIGFKKSLEDFMGERLKGGTKALILGTGGSSKAIKAALHQLKVPFRMVSRSEGKDEAGEELLTYDALNPSELRAYRLIINTTPLGMHPNITTAPDLPYQALTPEHFLYDLVYNPEQTKFLKLGQKAGARTRNGMEMLELQAEESWRIWQHEQ